MYRYRRMRKCPACGYLVFGDSESCKHCGAPLAPAATAPPTAPPAPVTSGAPPLTAMAVPPPVPRAGPPSASPPPPTPPIDRDYWSPPPPSAPAPSSRPKSRSVLVLVVVISMALGWVAFDHFANANALPPGTSAFVAGHGVPYTSPDHTFGAQFPATPTVESRVIPVSGTSATINMAHLQTDDYEIVAASMVLPISIPAAEVTPVLRDVLNKSATDQGDKIASQTEVNHFGVPGIEIRAKVSDGYTARFMVLISGSRIYLLGVHAKTGTDRLYDALLSSLTMY